MQTVGLSWQHSGELAAGLALAGGALALSKRATVRTAGAFVRETAMIGLLYGLWRLAGEVSGFSSIGAYDRARWINDFEHHLWLPSEASVQHLVIGHSLIVQVINLYYATMHFTMLFVFLIWLFVRHREHYRPVRTVLAWTTLCCLVIQLLPVAPPRLLPGLGIVDTGVRYNQSVYQNGFAADQLSAMPSVHVAWAVFIGYYAWRVGRSQWRCLGPAHAAITIFVVVATGNHWWLDGIVGVAVLAICAWAVFGVRTGWQALRVRWWAGLAARRPLAAATDPIDA